MRVQWLLLVWLSTQGPFATVQRASGPAECPEYDVISYEAPRKDTPGSLVLETRPDLPDSAGTSPHAQRSPKGTASYVVREPDTTEPGPWTTVVDVFGNKARPIHFRMRLIDHVSGGVRVSWLNEKLLWVQMWRGRIASIDAIVDVETGTLLYQQDANYNSLLVPCSMKPGVPK